MNIVVIQLAGSEAKKTIAEAMSNEDVVSLVDQMAGRGFVPMKNKAQASIVDCKNETISARIITAQVPMSSKTTGVVAMLQYTKDVSSNSASAAVYITGSGDDITSPMNVLQASESYKDKVNQIKDQNYDVLPSGVTITEVLTPDADIAMINATYKSTIDDSVTNIVALTDMKTNSILGISFGLPSNCDICKFVAGAVVSAAVTGMLWGNTFAICSGICAPSFAALGFGYVVCVGICWAIASFVISHFAGQPIAEATVCSALGYC